jgi:glycerol-3-phosphate dehydrogenase
VADLSRLREELAATSGMPRSHGGPARRGYGSRAVDVWQIGADAPELLEPFDEGTGAVGAELILAFRDEFAQTLTDALVRRTMVGMSAGQGLDAVERAARSWRTPRLGFRPRRPGDRELPPVRPALRGARPGELAGARPAPHGASALGGLAGGLEPDGEMLQP